MIVAVLLDDPTHPCTVRHEGDWVDVDTSDGELFIAERDKTSKVTGWTRYAKGRWLQVSLVAPVDPEVARTRDMERARHRVPGGDGGGAVSWGNSGPGGVTR